MKRKNKFKSVALASFLTLAGAIGYYHQNKTLTLWTETLSLGLERPLKIVHFSDLHGASFGFHNHRLLEKIKEQSPDLIFFTGDLVQNSSFRLGKMVTFLEAVNQIAPLYLAMGNHDHSCGRFYEICRKLREKDIKVLCDEIAHLEIDHQPISILGLDDNQYSRGAYRALKAGRNVYLNRTKQFEALAKQPGLKLVLCHFPENFALIGEKSYHQFAFDVMFAGHAHGGQFRLPFLGGLYAPGQGILPKYTGGLYGEEQGPHLVVTRGLGNSTFPFRLGNRPEIVALTLQ